MCHRPYHEATGTYGSRPRHDDARHAADAFGTFARALPKLTATPGSDTRPATVEPAL